MNHSFTSFSICPLSNLGLWSKRSHITYTEHQTETCWSHHFPLILCPYLSPDAPLPPLQTQQIYWEEAIDREEGMCAWSWSKARKKQGRGRGSPRQQSWHQACQHSRIIWTTLSDTLSDFWVALCSARSWIWWLLRSFPTLVTRILWFVWVLSNSGYSPILWFHKLLQRKVQWAHK